MEQETQLYNSVYKEISELIGLDAMLKLYLRFKGQQVTFPVRLYNSQQIQRSIAREFDGSNVTQLAQKYDYSERTIRRMIRKCADDGANKEEKR